jgi:predicted ATP-dependent endonuclease of OLD family
VSEHLQDLAGQAQVIATTHSPVLVDAVDLRSVCRLKREPSGLLYSWRPAPLNRLSCRSVEQILRREEQ